MIKNKIIGFILFAPFAIMTTLAIIFVPKIVWAVMLVLIIMGMGAIGFARILE